MSQTLAKTWQRLSPFAAAGSLLTAALALASGPSAAADLAIKAAPSPVYQWSGCYVGGNVGFGGNGTNFSTSVIPGTYLVAADAANINQGGSGGANGTNLVGGGQVGCNLQVNTFVFGVEGDYDYFRSNPNFNNNTGNTLSDGVTPFAVTQSVTTNYLATVRPRIGIAADRNLAYITGGVAFTNANYSETYNDGNGAIGAASTSKFLVGWAAGAGWEYAIAEHIDFRAEYLVAGFGNVSAQGAITGPGTATLQGSSNLLIQVGRAGVEFKF